MSRFFLNDGYYFITVPAIKRVNFFNTPFKKDLILKRIIDIKNKFNLKEIEYGINSNHYHLLLYLKNGNLIPKILHYVNGGSSFELNKIEKRKGRSIWDEYYIYYIDNEITLYNVRGYVIGNPYKHNEVANLKELINYPFSTFHKVVNKLGLKEAEEMVLSVIRINDEDFEKQFKNINSLRR